MQLDNSAAALISFAVDRYFFTIIAMLYEAEQGQVTLALCGDIMPSRRLAVFREAKFLELRGVLQGADACFANLESMVVRYGEGYRNPHRHPHDDRAAVAGRPQMVRLQPVELCPSSLA